MHVFFDASVWKTIQVFHQNIQEKLSLSDYYGHNLDALYDLLKERRDPLTITVYNAKVIEQNLGLQGSKILSTLKQINQEKSNITINFK